MLFAAIPGFEWLGTAIAHVLSWISSTIGFNNYGLSIIFLTLFMRAVILPLSIKQTNSMMGMQKLQPKIREIQKKHKNDREKQSQEMMALYKEHKVSPFGGCLPLLLQLPILFAVFDVLRSLSDKASEYRRILDVTDSSLNFLGMNISQTGNQLWQAPANAYAQIVVLIILTIITGYVSSKMLNQDPQQAKMMALMPVMMGFFAWILPAGVTTYIITTNCFTIIQQYLQLEHACYFDDRQRALKKLGDEATVIQKAALAMLSFGTKTMIALKLRPKPRPPKRKKPVKASGQGKGKPAPKAKGAAADGDEGGEPTTGKQQKEASPQAGAKKKRPQAKGTPKDGQGKKPKSH